MHSYGYQYQFQFDENGNSTGVGAISVPTTSSNVNSVPQRGNAPLSPTLPDHIYVRQEGSPQQAEIYDAETGKHVTNVTDVEVTLNRRESRVRVTASDGERTYPVQDLTVDANGS